MNKLLFRRILMWTTGIVGAAGSISHMLPSELAAGLLFVAGVLKQVPALLNENKPKGPARDK